MENETSAPLLPLRACLLGLICVALAAGKLSGAPSASPSPSATVKPTPPTGTVQPAEVGSGLGSFSKFLHFPKSLATGTTEGAVQFYCDILENGDVEITHNVVAKDDEFRTAVQSALDWGRFKPARLNGKPSAAYVAGTVLFLHREGQPLVVISLATQEKDRVGQLANYVQPQLIGGLRKRLGEMKGKLPSDVVPIGSAEVLVKVDEQGAIVSKTVVAEDPKTSGLGAFVDAALNGARFSPGYLDGKPTAGEINIVAAFRDAP